MAWSHGDTFVFGLTVSTATLLSTALHCTVLYFTTHCTALHCTALHCTALHYTALHIEVNLTALHSSLCPWPRLQASTEVCRLQASVTSSNKEAHAHSACDSPTKHSTWRSGDNLHTDIPIAGRGALQGWARRLLIGPCTCSHMPPLIPEWSGCVSNVWHLSHMWQVNYMNHLGDFLQYYSVPFSVPMTETYIKCDMYNQWQIWP